MPPKKKGKKGKKSGKKSGRKSAASASSGGGNLTELGKEFYLVQIRDLEQRLTRYQKKCDELDVNTQGYKLQQEQLAQDKKEIVSFLKKEMGLKQDEIADLSDRLVALQQSKDVEKDSYEQQLTQLRNEFQETKDQLTSENIILGGKLASLEQFKVQKEDLMAKFTQLEEELEHQKKKHKDTIYTLERKGVVDKDRLKKDMILRVNQVAAEFRKVSNKQMADTTKRTIRENVSINAQLQKMSDKTMELIHENDELQKKEKAHKQQIEMLETNEKEFAKKNHSNQKIIRMLTAQAKKQEQLLEEAEQREGEYQELMAEAQLLRQQSESSREELIMLSKENEELEEKVESLQKSLTNSEKEKQKIEKVLSEGAFALKAMLTKKTRQEVDSEDSDYDGVEERDNMLESLLVILNSAAAIGVGPPPKEFINKKKANYTIASSPTFPGTGQGIQRGEMAMSPLAKMGYSLPHYELGDLGFVPKKKRPSSSEEMRSRRLSSPSKFNQLRGIQKRSVGIQTASGPKAMFFADQLLHTADAESTASILQEFAYRGRPVLPQVKATKTTIT